MFSVNDVNKQLTAFYLNYYTNIKDVPPFKIIDNQALAPNGFSIVMVSLSGRATPVLLPSKNVSTDMVIGSGAKCKCNSGTGCVLGYAGSGTTSCVASNCKSCSLTVDTPSGEIDFKSFVY
jgi:hypothetical protein